MPTRSPPATRTASPCSSPASGTFGIDGLHLRAADAEARLRQGGQPVFGDRVSADLAGAEGALFESPQSGLAVAEQSLLGVEQPNGYFVVDLSPAGIILRAN